MVDLQAVREEQHMLPLAIAPPDDPRRTPAEQAAVDRIVSDAAGIVAVAALVWLQRIDSSTYASLLDAGRNYVASLCTTGKAVLDFRTRLSGRALDRQIAAPRLCQLYQLILTRMQTVWRQSVPLSQFPPRTVSRRGRVGASQHRGSAIWRAQMGARSAAVVNILDAVQVPVSPATARRWAEARPTPGKLALQILAHVLAKQPRTAKAVLSRARTIAGRRSNFTSLPFTAFARYVPILRHI